MNDEIPATVMISRDWCACNCKPVTGWFESWVFDTLAVLSGHLALLAMIPVVINKARFYTAALPTCLLPLHDHRL